MRFFPFDDPVHGEVTELLPWFVNGTLTSAERTRVERHVSECIACKHELANLRALQSAIAGDDPDPGATQALARLKARIEHNESRPRAKRLLQDFSSRWHGLGLGVRGVLVAQFVALIVVAGAYLSQPVPEYYRTLAAPAVAPDGDVVVVFQGASPEQEIREALLRVHATIVDGPSPEGAYTLKVRKGEQTAVLEQLRRQPLVKFCEPVARPAQTR